MSLNEVYFSEADLQKTVTLWPQAKRDLQWIISLSPHQCFTPLWCLSPEACDLEVQTDASNEDFGVWFLVFLHQGRWESTTAGLHINVLETIVLWHFLAFILPKSSKPHNILWRIDNTMALVYIKKEGGTINQLVLAEAEKALVLAHQMSIRILSVYIPTEKSILADAVSRFQEIPDWRLHPNVFQAITARWGSPRSPQSGEEAGDVERHLHPGLSPDVEGSGGSPPAFHGRLSDRSDNGQAAPDPSQPPSSCLEDQLPSGPPRQHQRYPQGRVAPIHRGSIRQSLAILQETSSFPQRST
jgi:hypothetical protein